MSLPTTSLVDTICQRALELGRHAGGAGQTPEGATNEVVAIAGSDRVALAAARDRLAEQLRADPADFAATGALTLLNRAVAAAGYDDRLDWKRRWAQHRKP